MNLLSGQNYWGGKTISLLHPQYFHWKGDWPPPKIDRFCVGKSGYFKRIQEKHITWTMLDEVDKGAHEQALMRSHLWMLGGGGGRDSGASTHEWCSENLIWCDAPWSQGWRVDGGKGKRDDVFFDWHVQSSDPVCRPKVDARSMAKMHGGVG